MTSNRVLPQSLEDAESRMGIDPIETLLADRADLIKRIAPLRARHGTGGTFEAQRKVKWTQIAMEIRAKAVAKPEKVTEAYIEQASHADPRYVDFITEAVNERVTFAELEDQIQAINDKINRGQAVARYLSAEVMLAR